ncbi:hypothetical protein [Thermincola ferriacetica]
MPRSEPDLGNPTVRDRRGASGNVAYSEKCARLTSIPTNHWEKMIEKIY